MRRSRRILRIVDKYLRKILLLPSHLIQYEISFL